jgi:hypothetical protein
MQALVPGWEVRTAGEDEWAVLSDRLEGSPLATEIVATLLRDHAISDVLSFTDNLDVVSMRAARQPAHHASFAEAVRWQLELLPRAIRDALVCVAVFRTRVGYELLLRAVQEMGVADARLTLTTLLDASLLETAERSPHRWMSRWVAQAVLAIESPELRERAQAIHARVVSTAAQDHMRRGKSPVTRVLSSEELAAAALHLPSGAPEDADVPWVRSLLDDVEVGLSTRDDPEAVAKFVETLPEFLPAAHPLAGAARFARAGRRLVSGERTAEPELAPGGGGHGRRRGAPRALSGPLGLDRGCTRRGRAGSRARARPCEAGGALQPRGGAVDCAGCRASARGTARGGHRVAGAGPRRGDGRGRRCPGGPRRAASRWSGRRARPSLGGDGAARTGAHPGSTGRPWALGVAGGARSRRMLARGRALRGGRGGDRRLPSAELDPSGEAPRSTSTAPWPRSSLAVRSRRVAPTCGLSCGRDRPETA